MSYTIMKKTFLSFENDQTLKPITNDPVFPAAPLVNFSCKKVEKNIFLLKAEDKNHDLSLSFYLIFTEKRDCILRGFSFSSPISPDFRLDVIRKEILTFFQYQILKKIAYLCSLKRINRAIFSIESPVLEQLTVLRDHLRLNGVMTETKILSTGTLPMTFETMRVLMKNEVLACRNAKETLFKEEKRHPSIRSYLKAVPLCKFWVLNDFKNRSEKTP